MSASIIYVSTTPLTPLNSFLPSEKDKDDL